MTEPTLAWVREWKKINEENKGCPNDIISLFDDYAEEQEIALIEHYEKTQPIHLLTENTMTACGVHAFDAGCVVDEKQVDYFGNPLKINCKKCLKILEEKK